MDETESRGSKNGGDNKARRNDNKSTQRMKLKNNETMNRKNHTTSTSTHQNHSNLASLVKNRVDPETVKYFSEITNLLENNSIDLEERSSICSNALEETRGKELELSTDFIISRTLQNLLESCDLDQLCGFLRGGSDSFVFISVDKCGSHVAETAVKALSKHLNDEGSYLCVQDTLTLICKIIAKDSINVMQSRQGSHVLRSLLCLCKGVPTEKFNEFHSTKRSDVLAARLNLNPVPADENQFENGFEKVFRDLVRGLIDNAKCEIVGLRADQFSSLVLQTALRLSFGDEKELIYLISVLLCENFEEGKKINSDKKREIMSLLDESASSHLLEVIIEVAPEKLYDKFLNEIFIGSFFDISSNQWGNFVMQALISSVKTKDQMDKIWEELGQKTKELLKLGKSGIAASLLVSCLRLQTNRRECCEALAGAVTLDNQSDGNNNNIIEHILYLDSFLMEASSWKWPSHEKMHVLGCLMLQTIFKYPKQYVRNYSESLLSMENEHIYQTAKDSGGARVIESFLASDAATKLKLKLIAKLKGYFGDLAMSASSSFAVEKCFSASNISLKEIICGELLEIRNDLSKTRHGFHLLKKFDIDLFARQPEQWKMSQKSKENAYGEFQALFGEPSDKKLKLNDPNNNNNINTNTNDVDEKLDNTDYQTSSPKTKKPKFNITPFKKDNNNNNNNNKNKKSKYDKVPFEKNSKQFLRNSFNTQFVRQNVKKESTVSELAQLAGKSELNAGDLKKLFDASMNNDKNQKKPFVSKRKRF